MKIGDVAFCVVCAEVMTEKNRHVKYCPKCGSYGSIYLVWIKGGREFEENMRSTVEWLERPDCDAHIQDYRMELLLGHIQEEAA